MFAQINVVSKTSKSSMFFRHKYGTFEDWYDTMFGTGRPGWEVNLSLTPDPQIQLLLNGGLFRFAICIFIHYIYIYIFLNINTGVNSYYIVLVAETSICKPSSESPSPRDYDWLCRIYIYIYIYIYVYIYSIWYTIQYLVDMPGMVKC